jgi:hypothetical protein
MFLCINRENVWYSRIYIFLVLIVGYEILYGIGICIKLVLNNINIATSLMCTFSDADGIFLSFFFCPFFSVLLIIIVGVIIAIILFIYNIIKYFFQKKDTNTDLADTLV